MIIGKRGTIVDNCGKPRHKENIVVVGDEALDLAASHYQVYPRSAPTVREFSHLAIALQTVTDLGKLTRDKNEKAAKELV